MTTEIVKGKSPWYGDDYQKHWDVLLYSTYDFQSRQSPRDVYYTHIFGERHDSLDHILVSEELVRQNPKSVGEVVAFNVYNDHLSYSDSVPAWSSDHGQPVATIKIKDREQNTVR